MCQVLCLQVLNNGSEILNHPFEIVWIYLLLKFFLKKNLSLLSFMEGENASPLSPEDSGTIESEGEGTKIVANHFNR